MYFDVPVTNLLSVLCILKEIFSRTHAKLKKGLNDFKIGTFIGRFRNDSEASMTAKGLSNENQSVTLKVLIIHSKKKKKKKASYYHHPPTKPAIPVLQKKRLFEEINRETFRMSSL